MLTAGGVTGAIGETPTQVPTSPLVAGLDKSYSKLKADDVKLHKSGIGNRVSKRTFERYWKAKAAAECCKIIGCRTDHNKVGSAPALSSFLTIALCLIDATGIAVQKMQR